MDPVFSFPASPGTPLFPVSPERANRQMLPTLPQSPSLPSNLSYMKHDPFISPTRNESDVQGKVAQFNNLSKEAVQRRKDNEAALKRAVVGREEAESETRRLKEDCKSLIREVEEGRGRERRVGERFEAVMEELHQAKETHSRSQALYEKEIRRARKEAFKSSSAMVKLQEELKATRNSQRAIRENVDLYKDKAEKLEQEAFAAQYQLVGVQEELDKVRQQIKIGEDERDVLKTALKEEEVARIAAEGRIALPATEDGDEFASPKKQMRHRISKPALKDVFSSSINGRSLKSGAVDVEEEDVFLTPTTTTRRGSLKENVDPMSLVDEAGDEIELLAEELRHEKRLRTKAEDLAHFMQMECQFRRCSCRIAEQHGIEFIHDGRFEAQIAQKLAESKIIASRRQEEKGALVSASPADEQTIIPGRPPKTPPPNDDTELLISFSAATATLPIAQLPPQSPPLLDLTPAPQRQHSEEIGRDIAAPKHPISLPQTSQHESSPLPPTPHHCLQDLVSTPLTVAPAQRPIELRQQRPQTMRVVSTTTTIPLADVFSPSKLSREEALEQIRQRRGRARSIAAGNLTPKKQMVEAGSLKRDISAPAGQINSGKKSYRGNQGGELHVL